MNAPVLAAVQPQSSAFDWRRAMLPIAIGLVVLGIAFNTEVVAAVQTWIDSTAYNHCFLVIPIAAFLLYERRTDLAGLVPQPLPAAALLGIPVAVVWLVAERLGIMEGRQLAVISFVELLLLAILGWRLWWAASGPLLYLYFLVPFGAFLTPKLQDITTFFIRHGLDLLGIPAYIDGYVIEIPQGTFFVAEACAGLRFLIASIAFGCLYALMMYRSPGRRAAFILASIIVPIIANGFRGLGIVALGYVLGSAQAAAADHIIYGWIFFSVVILMLIALGLPFRQDDQPTAPPRRPLPAPPLSMRAAFLAVAAVAIVALVSPILTAGLALAATRPAAMPASLAVGAGCTVAPSTPQDQSAIHSERITCGDTVLDMTWEAFSPRITAGPLMSERNRLSRRAQTEGLSEAWLRDDKTPHRPWSIMQSTEPLFILGSAIWVDGQPARPGMTMRLRMAIDSLFGTNRMPILVTLTPVVAWNEMTSAKWEVVQAQLTDFLRAHPDLDQRIAQLSTPR